MRIHRHFKNERTFETTTLRYDSKRGIVSRPERAGQDVGPHVFIRDASVKDCRRIWLQAQDALFAEGFVKTGTEWKESL